MAIHSYIYSRTRKGVLIILKYNGFRLVFNFCSAASTPCSTSTPNFSVDFCACNRVTCLCSSKHSRLLLYYWYVRLLIFLDLFYSLVVLRRIFLLIVYCWICRLWLVYYFSCLSFMTISSWLSWSWSWCG